MLEYAKQILPKITLWKKLFRKELIKCFQWTEDGERGELYNWCCENFSDGHSDVLMEVGRMYNLNRQNVRIPKNYLHTALQNNKKTTFQNAG